MLINFSCKKDGQLLEVGVIQGWVLKLNKFAFKHTKCILKPQRAKKLVSNSLGLVDFAIGLVNSVINLSNGQVEFFEEFKLQKNREINLLIKTFVALV